MKNYEFLGLPLLPIIAGIRFLRERLWKSKKKGVPKLHIWLKPPNNRRIFNALFSGTNLGFFL